MRKIVKSVSFILFAAIFFLFGWMVGAGDGVPGLVPNAFVNNILSGEMWQILARTGDSIGEQIRQSLNNTMNSDSILQMLADKLNKLARYAAEWIKNFL